MTRAKAKETLANQTKGAEKTKKNEKLEKRD
jgi:hypothetical protein